jgi:hypothetical protein
MKWSVERKTRNCVPVQFCSARIVIALARDCLKDSSMFVIRVAGRRDLGFVDLILSFLGRLTQMKGCRNERLSALHHHGGCGV